MSGPSTTSHRISKSSLSSSHRNSKSDSSTSQKPHSQIVGWIVPKYYRPNRIDIRVDQKLDGIVYSHRTTISVEPFISYEYLCNQIHRILSARLEPKQPKGFFEERPIESLTIHWISPDHDLFSSRSKLTKVNTRARLSELWWSEVGSYMQVIFKDKPPSRSLPRIDRHLLEFEKLDREMETAEGLLEAGIR